MADAGQLQLLPNKRKRVTKACLQCAKSRRKCDGVQPYCGTCRTQGVVCTWSEVSTRRGPPKGYRRGAADPLSLLPKIAKIREQVQALQVAYGEKAVKEELHKSIWGIPTCDYVSVPGTPSCSTSSGACTATATSHMRSESPHHSRERKHEWGHEEIDDHSNSDQGEGSSSGMAFLANMRNVHSPNGAPLTPVSDAPLQKYSPWPRGERLNEETRRPPQVESYTQPRPDEVEILMKTYWTSIHPHWPILYKPAFDKVSIFKVKEEIHTALLYSMFALAARLVTQLAPETSQQYRRIAEDHVFQGGGSLRSDINIITALFLLSLHSHGEGKQRQAWVYCGLASIMALDHGLHKSAKNLPIMEHERRVRVFWNLYVYEKVLAAEMGRPFHVRMVHCDPVRLSEDQADEYETLAHHPTGDCVRLYTISVFNSSVDLFRIFERILSEVHTVPTPVTTRAARERLATELDQELEKWQKALQPRCAYPVKDDKHPTRSLYLTHAWYHIAIILIHRPLIPRIRPGQAFESNVHHKKVTEAADQLVDLLAQFAAGQAIDTLPPNDAYLIFSAALVYAYNLRVDDRSLRESARKRLQQCIEWLKGLAETWSTASEYKHLLDAFSHVAWDNINQSHQYSPHGSQQAHSPPEIMYASNHSDGHASTSGITYVDSSPQHQQAVSHARTHGHGRSHSMPQASPHHQHAQYPHAIHGNQPETPLSSTSMTSEVEQKNFTPQLFGLDTYYWNDYHHQIGYQQPQQFHYYNVDSNDVYGMQGHEAVLTGVIRRMCENQYPQ